MITRRAMRSPTTTRTMASTTATRRGIRSSRRQISPRMRPSS
jgi:hypothetical protein